MVLLILESHRALHFGHRVDETAQWIAGQRVVVSARVHVIEPPRLRKIPLRVDPREQEPLNLVRRIQRVSVFFELLLSKQLQHTARVARIRRSALVDHIAEHQHLPGSENIRRREVKRGPVDPQPQIALPLRGKAANRRPIEREIVEALHQKLLVVIQHVEAALQIAEQNRDRLNSLLIGQVLQPLFLNLVEGHALPALILGFQIELLQLLVRERQEIPIFSRHASPLHRD